MGNVAPGPPPPPPPYICAKAIESDLHMPAQGQLDGCGISSIYMILHHLYVILVLLQWRLMATNTRFLCLKNVMLSIQSDPCPLTVL